MDHTQDSPGEELPHHFKPKMYGIFGIVLAIFLLGIWLVSAVTKDQVARDELHWQDKLNLIADSRQAEVARWVDENFSELKTLAANPSLQLYLTELKMLESAENTSDEPSQKSYLRNLINYTAERGGFISASGTATGSIPANVEPTSIVGIAIQDAQGRPLVTTPMSLPAEGPIAQELADVPAGAHSLIDISRSEKGELVLGFVVPVYAIQGDQNEQSATGRIVAFKEVTTLFDLLRHPGVTENTLEVLLVRERGENVQYISPLLDNSKPLEKSLKSDFQNLSEAAAVRKPGTFLDFRDYRGKRVFAMARAIEGTPWTLVAKIDREEALAQSTVRTNGMTILLLLALVIVVVTIVAVWRNASARRSRVLSRRFKLLADRATAQEHLLRIVSDNQPEAVFIIDSEQRYQFANQQAANVSGMSKESMHGKKVADVIGAARAQEVLKACEEVLERGQAVVSVRREEEGKRTIRAEHIPLIAIPIQSLPENTPGVLVVEQDVSELVQERESRMRTQRQLIDMLIMFVDKRDPHAAHHSALVSRLSAKVAESLGLDTQTRETAEIAGSLMNIGKIVISEQVLTKPEMLSDDERKSIRDSVYASAELLKSIHFDGPVVETLRQSQEQWDGSGPKCLKGENILIGARIVAVVNAFVGMVSPRSYRSALSFDAALRNILEQADRQFDRKIVIALADYIENKGGKKEIESVLGLEKKSA